MDTGAEGISTRSTDSPQAFKQELRALRRDHGNEGFKTLARKMELSHGSVHAALRDGAALPSEYVLAKMIRYWAPEDVGHWVSRRANLTAPEASDHETMAAPPSTSIPPTADRTEHEPGRRHRWPYLLPAVTAGVVIGAGLTTPIPIGGVDVWAHCNASHGNNAAAPPAQHAGDWSSWSCRTQGGKAAPVDMTRACEQQHPPLTPLGRTYADHTDATAESWQCYTAQISLFAR